MPIQIKKYSRLVVWVAAALTLVLADAPSQAAPSPHILLVTAQSPPTAGSSLRRRELLEISQLGINKIADLSFRLLFGKDNKTLAILDLQDGPEPTRWRLHAINRESSKVTDKTDIKLKGILPLPTIQTVLELIAVQSKDSLVYFPAISYEKEPGYRLAQANWQTASVGLAAEAPKSLRGFDVFAPTPFGFGILFNDADQSPPKPTLALFDATSKKLRLLALPDAIEDSSLSDQLFFVPTVGLVEYHHAALFKLTGTTLSTNSAALERTPISEVNSQIFVYNINRKPVLIWGENPNPQSQFGTISDIVIYDWNSKQVLLRKSLGTSTHSFLPDVNGSKVYFVDAAERRIMVVDVKRQSIDSFAELTAQDAAGLIIVDAY